MCPTTTRTDLAASSCYKLVAWAYVQLSERGDLHGKVIAEGKLASVSSLWAQSVGRRISFPQIGKASKDQADQAAKKRLGALRAKTTP
eukprot:1574223-Amphidinium_carterae.1